MTIDIEKLIEEMDLPEMEYVKKGRKTVTISREEQVPEIVLPKTKAEEYKEARERLNRKTTAASKGYEPGKKRKPKPSDTAPTPRKKSSTTPPKRKEPPVKTVELDSAAAKAFASASNADRHKKHTDTLKSVGEQPKWVGAPEEIVPFAWRHPLTPVSRPSKLYRAAFKSGDPSFRLPAPKNNA